MSATNSSIKTNQNNGYFLENATVRSSCTYTTQVMSYGTAIMYNLATKTVKTVIFDDVAPELAMAVLQFLNSRPGEELLWRAMTAVCRHVFFDSFYVFYDSFYVFYDSTKFFLLRNVLYYYFVSFTQRNLF